MKFSKQSKTSLQSFIITFFASLILFIVAAFLLYKAVPSLFNKAAGGDDPLDDDSSIIANADSSDKTNNPNKDEHVINGDSFSILVAGYNIKGDSFDAMVIVDVNKETKKLTLYPINTEASICVGENEKKNREYLDVRLSDLCRYKDMNYICEKVRAVTGLNITNYITFTADDFINAVDILNKNKAYTYTVKKDMSLVYSNDPELEKYNINFKADDKLTSGIDLYNLLRYKGDSTSERIDRQASVAHDMAKALVASQFENKTLSGAISTFTSLLRELKGCKTNISPDDFISRSFDLISAINSSSFTTGISKTYKNKDAFFKPSDTGTN